MQHPVHDIVNLTLYLLEEYQLAGDSMLISLKIYSQTDYYYSLREIY